MRAYKNIYHDEQRKEVLTLSMELLTKKYVTDIHLMHAESWIKCSHMKAKVVLKVKVVNSVYFWYHYHI